MKLLNKIFGKKSDDSDMPMSNDQASVDATDVDAAVEESSTE